MQKAYIFCNNPESYLNNKFLFGIKFSGIVIAANGGANYLCKNGQFPDVLIGDCDSILPKYLKLLENKAIINKFPADKDKSDSELALDFCFENGYNDVTLVNAINGRLSHSLANLFLAEKYAEQGIKLHFLNQKNEIFVIKDRINASTKNGAKISLIPLTKSTFVEKTNGLKFPLKKEKLYRANSRGISNKATKENFSVKISSGILLVIKER